MDCCAHRPRFRRCLGLLEDCFILLRRGLGESEAVTFVIVSLSNLCM